MKIRQFIFPNCICAWTKNLGANDRSTPTIENSVYQVGTLAELLYIGKQ